MIKTDMIKIRMRAAISTFLAITCTHVSIELAAQLVPVPTSTSAIRDPLCVGRFKTWP
jgi:hypothetical protein